MHYPEWAPPERSCCPAPTPEATSGHLRPLGAVCLWQRGLKNGCRWLMEAVGSASSQGLGLRRDAEHSWLHGCVASASVLAPSLGQGGHSSCEVKVVCPMCAHFVPCLLVPLCVMPSCAIVCVLCHACCSYPLCFLLSIPSSASSPAASFPALLPTQAGDLEIRSRTMASAR